MEAGRFGYPSYFGFLAILNALSQTILSEVALLVNL